MTDESQQAAELRAAAEQLLEQTSLLRVLAEEGTVFTTGSYRYDLMTWRDIDLCLAVEKPDPRSAMDLAKRLATMPNVGSLYFRNEFVLKTVGNPRAIFLCLEFFLPDSTRWKIDVLIADAEEVGRVLEEGDSVLGRLTPDSREAILRIKSVVCSRPEYRTQYGSRAIYEAVLEHHVKTVEEWDAWYRGTGEDGDHVEVEGAARPVPPADAADDPRRRRSRPGERRAGP